MYQTEEVQVLQVLLGFSDMLVPGCFYMDKYLSQYLSACRRHQTGITNSRGQLLIPSLEHLPKTLSSFACMLKLIATSIPVF